ncbi:hypothetical protein L1987_46611 [Smallanthus sonchifolius]|uniref:Uncharacterized protein n=1 Tax=Smallanthus sonchifolius TaxID=185202 RepID=A0ACB9G166_9ASTR|nr:hypothetical protein L1987_46611 [Smallanthus sonchifolius]
MTDYDDRTVSDGRLKVYQTEGSGKWATTVVRGGPPSGYYQRSDSMEDTKTGEHVTEEPAPTFPIIGMTSFTADGQPAVEAGEDYVPPPTHSDLKHPEVSWTSDNREPDKNNEAGQPPSRDDLGHQNYSETGVGGTDSYEPPPGLSGVAPRDASQPSGASSTADPGSQEYVEYSLNGKIFKDVNHLTEYLPH